jgi:hypothetical protein
MGDARQYFASRRVDFATFAFWSRRSTMSAPFCRRVVMVFGIARSAARAEKAKQASTTDSREAMKLFIVLFPFSVGK